MDSKSIIREWDEDSKQRALDLCKRFIDLPAARRFVFGRNVYTEAVAGKLELAGVIDDFTSETSFAGLPVVKTDDLPADAMVLAASGGRPLTVRKLLDARGIANLDYFQFQKWSGLDLSEAVFNEGFGQRFADNQDKVDWLFARLADEESREILRKLLSFRYNHDLKMLEGFTERQTEQYFEPFFTLSGEHPVFVDVGGFDGYTSAEFVRKCPGYDSVFIFEPEPFNGKRCQERLASFGNIHVLPFGAGQENCTLRFSSDGSASAVRENGEFEVEIRRIDDLVDRPPTFIKIDIEGSESMAIEGARNSIATHKPALAIAVYHGPGDFWDIPCQVLSINDDYKIYIRHYTESIYETVMYFVPPAYEVR